jgi:hypothetical protein
MLYKNIQNVTCVTLIDRQTDGQIWKDKQTEWWTEGWIERWNDRQAGRHIRQTNRQTDKQTNRQTDKQTNGKTDRQTDRHQMKSSYLFYFLISKAEKYIFFISL